MASHRQNGTSGVATWSPAFPRLPAVLFGIAVLLALLSIGLPNIAPGVPFMAAEGSPVRLFFGVSEEMNLPTFFSVLTLVTAAATLVLVGVLTGGRTGQSFAVAAGLLALLAFDDFAALHERLNDLGLAVAPETFSGPGYLWTIPASLIALVVLAAFWRLATRLHGTARRFILLGLLVFLFAAMGLETLNGFLDRPGTDGAPLQIGTHLEEVTENLGIILILRGALSLLQVARGRGRFSLRLVPADDGQRLGADAAVGTRSGHDVATLPVPRVVPAGRLPGARA
jgi:hypothetical protein